MPTTIFQTAKMFEQEHGEQMTVHFNRVRSMSKVKNKVKNRGINVALLFHSARRKELKLDKSKCNSTTQTSKVSMSVSADVTLLESV